VAPRSRMQADSAKTESAKLQAQLKDPRRMSSAFAGETGSGADEIANLQAKPKK